MNLIFNIGTRFGNLFCGIGLETRFLVPFFVWNYNEN
jgi:hypothetical protein